MIRNLISVCLFTLIAALSCLSTLAQEATVTPIPPLPKILPFHDLKQVKDVVQREYGARHKLYEAIGNLEYSAICTHTFTGASELLPGSLHYKTKGEKYWYDVDPVRLKTSGDEYSFLSCFNGEVTQKFSKSTGYMTIQKGLQPDGGTLYMRNYLFLPDFYFPTVFAAGCEDVLKPSTLANPEIWSSFFHSVTMLGVATIAGRDSWVIEVPVQKEVLTGLPAVARIYLDPELGCFPVGWDVSTEAGERLYTYRVEKVGLSAVGHKLNLAYPEEATVIGYVEDAKPVGRVTNTSALSILKIMVNAEINDEDLSIDPSSANGIYDADANVYIQVPK